MSLAEILSAVEPATVTGAASSGLEVFGVRADSRLVEPGELFAALKGERVDGHDFVAAAVERGAAAVLAERPVAAPVPVLLVDSVLAALGRLAARHRLNAQALTVAVTGSAGKTTVKETLARLLAPRFSVAKNYKNFNNQLGLPLSVLAASGSEDVWVMEAGVSRPGDMDDLAAVIQPDVAVIHNVGPAHLEGLGSVAGVAAEKAKLLDWIRLGGAAVVSADYPELWAEAGRREWGKERELIGFSVRPDVSSGARYVGERLGGRGGLSRYRLEFDGRAVTVDLPLLGVHVLENLLAVAAAAGRCGVTSDELAGLFEAALAGAPDADAPAGRFACRDQGRYLVIDDAYNANPLSMVRAVDGALEAAGAADADCPPRGLILVLGEMGELGAASAEAHRELGRHIADQARRADLPAVFFQGGEAATEAVGAGLAQGGYRGLWRPVAAPAEFLAGWRELGLPAAALLFKGSRAARLETYVTAFEATLDESSEDPA